MERRSSGGRTRFRQRNPSVVIKLPINFSFRSHAVHDFEPCLSIFNWQLKDARVVIDFTVLPKR